MLKLIAVTTMLLVPSMATATLSAQTYAAMLGSDYYVMEAYTQGVIDTLVVNDEIGCIPDDMSIQEPRRAVTSKALTRFYVSFAGVAELETARASILIQTILEDNYPCK